MPAEALPLGGVFLLPVEDPQIVAEGAGNHGRDVGGDVQLISLQTTDLSGNIAPVTVPAPPPSADQRDPEAYHYDISVQAAGYYREHSTDVPVFPHITSMQTFEMIPLPAGTDDPFPGGDITYYNGMQKY